MWRVCALALSSPRRQRKGQRMKSTELRRKLWAGLGWAGLGWLGWRPGGLVTFTVPSSSCRLPLSKPLTLHISTKYPLTRNLGFQQQSVSSLSRHSLQSPPTAAALLNVDYSHERFLSNLFLSRIYSMKTRTKNEENKHVQVEACRIYSCSKTTARGATETPVFE